MVMQHCKSHSSVYQSYGNNQITQNCGLLTVSFLLALELRGHNLSPVMIILACLFSIKMHTWFSYFISNRKLTFMISKITCKKGILQKTHGCLLGSKQKQTKLCFLSLQGSWAGFALIEPRCCCFYLLCTASKKCCSL